MQALSQDLRERIVESYEAGEGSYEVIAERFSVGPTVVGNFVRQKRDLGTLAAQVHRRGRKAAVTDEKKIELRKHLEEHPDATVLERRDALGLKCSEKTMWQTLRKMGWRFKKNRRVRQSKIEQTLL
jgi:transposase